MTLSRVLYESADKFLAHSYWCYPMIRIDSRACKKDGPRCVDVSYY